MMCVTFFTLARSRYSVTDVKVSILKLNPRASCSFNRSTMLLVVKFLGCIYYRFMMDSWPNWHIYLSPIVNWGWRSDRSQFYVNTDIKFCKT
jgi:hypothetical protein